MMIEFRRQQIVNKHSYFLITNGVHSFNAYNKSHFQKCLSIFDLENNPEEIDADSIKIYPPIDGLIEENQLIEVYPFRKKSVAKYGVKSEEHTRTDLNWKMLKKQLEKGKEIKTQALIVSKEDLNSVKLLPFTLIIDGVATEMKLNNWFVVVSW